MNFYLLGINHHTAPVALREQLAFDPSTLGERLVDLAAQAGVREAAILSTCNRTELYCVTDVEPPALSAWLLDHSQFADQVADCLYEHSAAEVARHASEVAAGLDSAILGEPQILGQMKDAYRLAQAQATAGPGLHRLFQHAFSVAKKVRSETAIGSSYVSAASVTVDLARQIFAGFEEHTALFVGAGEMIELALRHLMSNGLGRAIIANRSLDRARRLAGEFDALVVALDQVGSHIHEADIVISCTASPTPVICYEDLRRALRRRRRRPILLIDLAVPRDVEAACGELSDAYLFTVDDLHDVVAHNQSAREEAALAARDIVAAETARFARREDALDAVPLIKSVRGRLNQVRDQALAQAQRQIAAGRPVDEVLERLADTITQRLLHEPSARMREAGEQGDRELLDVAEKLFGVREEP